ncbi:MAG: hypothetical protein J7M08_03675 [Planctomycetes bacterium]|nr:hypothetical protein [Planctomycetota bacterium]
MNAQAGPIGPAESIFAAVLTRLDDALLGINVIGYRDYVALRRLVADWVEYRLASKRRCWGMASRRCLLPAGERCPCMECTLEEVRKCKYLEQEKGNHAESE